MSLLTIVTLSWCFTFASADQMLVYDSSNATNSYKFTCPPDGGWCLVKGEYSTSSYGPTGPIVEAIESDRFFSGYDDAYELLTGDAFTQVVNCLAPLEECSVTCESPCECRMAEGDHNAPHTLACTVMEVIPDTSISAEAELTLFNTSVHGDEDRVEFRCPGQFQTCQQTSVDGQYEGSYLTAIFVDKGDNSYATDFQNCQNFGVETDTCIVACDPRCTCAQIIDAETVACETIPNPLLDTDAPTTAPVTSAATYKGYLPPLSAWAFLVTFFVCEALLQSST